VSPLDLAVEGEKWGLGVVRDGIRHLIIAVHFELRTEKERKWWVIYTEMDIYIYIVGKKMGWIEVVDEFNLLFICGVWI